MPFAPCPRSRCRWPSACLQILGQPQVVHHEAAGLVLEHPVHSCNSLHKSVSSHRLVHVHGVQAGRVEPREPHVPHQHDLQRIGRDRETGWASPSRRALFLMCGCHSGGVGGRAGHHDLDCSLVVIVFVPVGAKARQLPVEVDADASAHADDHRFAVEGIQALLEVGHDVLGNLLHPLLRANDGLQAVPTSS